MTDQEANDILCRSRWEDGAPTLIQVLEAHAQMWRGAAPGMMREHSWYIQEAADALKKCETTLRAIADDPSVPAFIRTLAATTLQIKATA